MQWLLNSAVASCNGTSFLSPLRAGFSVNAAGPVFVTVTTDCVTLLLTRLFPKLNDDPLNEAVVDTGGAALTVTPAVTL